MWPGATRTTHAQLRQRSDCCCELLVVWRADARDCIPSRSGGPAWAEVATSAARGATRDVVERLRVGIDERIEEAERRLASREPKVVEQCKDAGGGGGSARLGAAQRSWEHGRRGESASATTRADGEGGCSVRQRRQATARGHGSHSLYPRRRSQRGGRRSRLPERRCRGLRQGGRGGDAVKGTKVHCCASRRTDRPRVATTGRFE